MVSVLDIRTRSEDKLYLFLSSVRSHLEHAAGSTPKKSNHQPRDK